MDRPKRFYKYRSLDGDAGRHVGSVIFDGKFYFGGVDGFDDPFEGLPEFVWEGSPKEMVEQWIAWFRTQGMSENEAVNRGLHAGRPVKFDKADAVRQYQAMI